MCSTSNSPDDVRGILGGRLTDCICQLHNRSLCREVSIRQLAERFGTHRRLVRQAARASP
jgi:AraC-like DNA-binding protein